MFSRSKIVKFSFLILYSTLSTVTVLLFLAYTNSAAKIIDVILKIAGYDVYQGEDKSQYIFNSVILLAIFVFLLFLFIWRYLLFKTKSKKK